jgi:hypothetical protein
MGMFTAWLKRWRRWRQIASMKREAKRLNGLALEIWRETRAMDASARQHAERAWMRLEARSAEAWQKVSELETSKDES